MNDEETITEPQSPLLIPPMCEFPFEFEELLSDEDIDNG